MVTKLMGALLFLAGLAMILITVLALLGISQPTGLLERLRKEFGSAVHSRPRVFIAHETKADYEHVHGAIAQQIIPLLTGLAEERLGALGGVTFRDAVTEQELLRA